MARLCLATLAEALRHEHAPLQLAPWSNSTQLCIFYHDRPRAYEALNRAAALQPDECVLLQCCQAMIFRNLLRKWTDCVQRVSDDALRRRCDGGTGCVCVGASSCGAGARPQLAQHSAANPVISLHVHHHRRGMHPSRTPPFIHAPRVLLIPRCRCLIRGRIPMQRRPG